MMKLNSAGILISLLPTTLDSRDGATQIADTVREYSGDKQIELDFSGIELMSHSFADQFHKELYLRDKDAFEIVIKNADTSIIRMLDAVSKTQTKLFFQELRYLEKSKLN